MLLKKIVIAEDEDSIAHMLSAALGDAGYLCLRARDGEEAMALVRAQLPDVLILDVMMPKLTGLEVVKKLKSDIVASRVPVLMLTSLTDVDDKVHGLDAGADDYLVKPFDFRELRARVKALIRQSHRERDRDPTTNLPTAQALEQHVEGLISQQQPFQVAFFEIEGFQACFDQSGFVAAQALSKRLGEIVLDRARGLGFAANLGPADFVVLTTDSGAQDLATEISQIYADASAEVCGTRVRTVVVDGDGCQSIEDLSARIAKARGVTLG